MKLDNALDCCKLIDNAMKGSYKNSQKNESVEQSYDSSFANQSSSKKLKRSMVGDLHKGIDKTFEPLLKNRSEQSLIQNFENSVSINNYQKNMVNHSKHSRNRVDINMKPNYVRTQDIPILEQPQLSESKLDIEK